MVEPNINVTGLQVIEKVLEILTRALISVRTRINISDLLHLRNLLPTSPTLESLLASAITDDLPLCHDGVLPPTAAGAKSILEVAIQSSRRWSQRLNSDAVEIDVAPFIEHAPWTDSTVDIITATVYKQVSSRSALGRWLVQESALHHNAEHLARILYAFFDTCQVQDTAEHDTKIVLKYVPVLFHTLLDSRRSDATRSACCSTLCTMFKALHSARGEMVSILHKQCKKLQSGSITPHLFTLARRISQEPEASSVVGELIDIALAWIVRQFSDKSTDLESEKEILIAVGEC